MKDDDIGREQQTAIRQILFRLEDVLDSHSSCFSDECNVLEDIRDELAYIRRENDA